MKLFSSLMLGVVALGFTSLVASTASIAQTTDEFAVARTALETKFPKAKIGNLRKSPVAGLYEATIDMDVIYIEPTGKLLFAGALYNIATMENLVESRQNELFGFKWDELPLAKAVKVVRGKGTRRMAVFTDADCPFCKRLEQTIAQMDDITVYNFLMPIDSLHPDAGRKSKIIWCSKDPTKAWLDFMLQGKLVEGKGDCPNPVDELKALGQSKRVNGTPAIVLPDNRTLAGAQPQPVLEEAINRAEATAKAKKS